MPDASLCRTDCAHTQFSTARDRRVRLKMSRNAVVLDLSGPTGPGPRLGGGFQQSSAHASAPNPMPPPPPRPPRVTNPLNGSQNPSAIDASCTPSVGTTAYEGHALQHSSSSSKATAAPTAPLMRSRAARISSAGGLGGGGGGGAGTDLAAPAPALPNLLSSLAAGLNLPKVEGVMTVAHHCLVIQQVGG